MTLFRGLGARKDATRGTTPIEVRKVLAGLFSPVGGIGARSGILPGADSPLVTGNATWAYNVGLFHAYVSRSAADGGQVYGNDGSALIGATGVGTTVPIAPASGLQRIDIIWTRHPTNTENADTASEPLFGVASGAEASTAVAPSIPTGAIELGRNLMTSAATSTVSAGNTITQTALYTALRGAPILVRNQTERDALGLYDGLSVYRLDTHVTEIYASTAWVVVGGGGMTLISAGPLSGSTALSLPDDSFTSLYKNYLLLFDITSAHAANTLLTMRWRVAGADSSAASYLTDLSGTNAAAFLTLGDYVGAGATAHKLMQLGTNYPQISGVLNLRSPNEAIKTTFQAQMWGANPADNGPCALQGGGLFNATTVFDSLTLISAAGALTINYQLFGYADA